METLNVTLHSNSTIEHLAEVVLSNFGYDLGKPMAIDITSLAQKLGLNVYSVSLSDSSGYIKFEGNEKNIYVNNLDSIKRQRFTIAHEIGHFLLHASLIEKESGSKLYRNDSVDLIEQQANRCAAALLMPEQLIKKAWDELNYSQFSKIPILANLFKVSIEAMYVRLSVLGLID